MRADFCGRRRAGWSTRALISASRNAGDVGADGGVEGDVGPGAITGAFARSLVMVDSTIEQQGPVARSIAEREPFGPMEHLGHGALVAAQADTLATPRRKPGLSARCLFIIMDVVYGKPRTLEKFRVLGLVARVPYQAWENVAYVAVTHTARQPGFARRVFDRVRASRWEQDNEQWHLLILEELTRDAPRGSWLTSRVLPQILAFGYYQLSWMNALRPAWSCRLNADFEDHAEHEYALLVQEHPE
jgi:ubiquinol oxidase